MAREHVTCFPVSGWELFLWLYCVSWQVSVQISLPQVYQCKVPKICCWDAMKEIVTALGKEPCSVVASQLWLFLFSRARVAVRRMGQGVVPTQPWCLVAKIPPRGQMLDAYSEMCASCWQKTLVVLHRRAGAVLRVKKIRLPLFFIKGCKEGEEPMAFKFKTLHSERVGWRNED